MIVVAILLVVDVVAGGGGGGDDATPGQSISPANAETTSASIRTIAAQVRRKVFIVRSPPSCEVKILPCRLDQL
jgi:hypothetical protein